MSEKDLIRLSIPFAKEIPSQSWMHLASTLAAVALAYALTLSLSNIWLKIFFSIITGLTLVRMFILFHDHQHNTILRKSRLANAIMTFIGLWMLCPKSIWKRSHDYHHQHNSKLYMSSIGSYPIVTVEKFKTFTRKERNLYLFIRHPVTIVAGYLFVFIYGMCIRSMINNWKKHKDSLLALIIHAVVGFTIYYFYGWTGLVLGFFLPYILTFSIGSYLFYAQHNFPKTKLNEKEGWTYVGAAVESSSYMTMNRAMHWFTGNIGFHHIHHLNPHIPFYRLREAFKQVPAFQHAKKTSLSFKDIYACFKLRAWDPDRGRMVTKHEMA